MGKIKIITEESGFRFDKVAEAAYERLGQKENISVEISFVGEDEIRSLNKEFRQTDKVTDVLSFPYMDGIKGKVLEKREFPDELDENGDILLGSVCICPQVAQKQAEEYGHSLEREILYLALHGILHCFGFDHVTAEDEREMSEVAEDIMQAAGVTRG